MLGFVSDSVKVKIVEPLLPSRRETSLMVTCTSCCSTAPMSLSLLVGRMAPR